ncbi:MAG: 5' nucleotidase, NT5C type, partial [Actinomycetes bacterium]
CGSAELRGARSGRAGSVSLSDFVLGVDLDGVCGDYTAAFRAVVALERDVDPSTLTDDVSWDFAEWGLTRETFLQVHRRAVEHHRMFRSMPPIDGVADALWRLSDAGVWIRIITHRLVTNWGHALMVGDTVGWLDQQRIPYRDLCFLGRKVEVQASAYVEDAPHNIIALRESGNTVVVFDQPYNAQLEGPRAASWTDVEAIVSDLVAETLGSYDAQMPGMASGAERLDRRRVTGDELGVQSPD